MPRQSQGNAGEKAKEFYAKIVQFYTKQKRMPTYQELAKLLGFASKNAAYKVVDKFIEKGELARDSAGKLIPGRKFFAGQKHGQKYTLQQRSKQTRPIFLLGLIEAGMPSVAEEQNLDTISLDEDIVQKTHASYALRVKGDSMIDAGIHDGDLVLVEKKEHARLGDIVVAEIDGDWTLKYLRERRGKKYLEAANPEYPDLHPKESLRIGGVVRAVVRKY